MSETKKGYTIYCDESRHTTALENPYMAIGGLWVPTGQKSEVLAALRSLLRYVGLGAEVKWSKTSRLKLDAYRAIVDFFREQPLYFRAIVVNQAKLDYEQFKDGDDELGFYTFYYEMLVKWMQQPVDYNVLLDFKKDRSYGHKDVLARCLRHKISAGATLRNVHSIDSTDTPLAQLADVLTGAVAASWCGLKEGSPKSELAKHIAAAGGMSSLKAYSLSPAFEKINIFKITLR